MNTDSDYYHIEAGLIYRPQIRHLLDRFKFERELEDYMENKSWHGSSFTVRGLTPTGQRYVQQLVAAIHAEQAKAKAEQEQKQAEQKKACEGVAGFIGAIVALILFSIVAYAFFTA